MRSDRMDGVNVYCTPTIRQWLEERRIDAVITSKADEIPNPTCDREASRERDVMERLINRLKRWRRIATS